MINLFLDTSDHLIIGLLNNENKWVDYLNTEEGKGSGVIHGLIHEMLERNQFKMKDINEIFMLAGPGSYTGMRLGEGVAQVLEMQDRKIYSCYHFDIPSLIGIEKGIWTSKAFKGELFVYHWATGSEPEKLLLQEEDFADYLESLSGDYELFTNSLKYTDDKFENFSNTIELMERNNEVICNYLKENNIRKEPYYYRPLDKEFKQSV